MNMDGPALLDLQNVTVMRGQKIVLESFSLRVRGDEHIAILGPNGCGKSTLIKTITRECYPLAQEGSSMTILGQERWDVSSCVRCWALSQTISCPDAPARLAGATSSSPAFSAAPASFRIILSTPGAGNWRTPLWHNCRYRTWRNARSRKCRRGKR